jgi:hypothetical protein
MLTLDNVVLEVTRRCNMECMHCMRGKAQPIDLDMRVLDALLEQCSQIASLTLTGGEVTLVPGIIREIARKIAESDVEVSSFQIVTNGKVVPDEFMIALVELYMACSDEIEYRGSLEVSKDEYHEGYSYDIAKYEVFSFYRKDTRLHINNDSIIDEGYAFENGLGRRSEEPEEWNVEDWGDDDATVLNTIHISVRGDLVTSCDLSWERIDNEKEFNILETPIIDKVNQELEKLELEEA